jgi:predicted Zn-dependent protease
MRCVIAGALTASLALLSGCETVNTTAPGAVGIEREQKMLVSEEEVEKGAEQAYAQELNKARKQGKLNKNEEDLARVRRISERLIPQVAVFRPDAVNWDWEINVQQSKEMNAYCMPGGKIMVYSGLIHQLDVTDAELSAVIGHEISHALREHSRERISQAYAQQLAIAGVAAVAGVSPGVADLANQVATVTFQLPHSREQEAEADRMGLELMARAGYDPEAAVSLWRKMGNASSGGPPEFLSTHPSGESRIADLQKSIPRVMPLYNAAKG